MALVVNAKINVMVKKLVPLAKKKKLKENLYTGPLSFIINSFLTEEKSRFEKRRDQNSRQTKSRAGKRARKEGMGLNSGEYLIVSDHNDNIMII